jgi:formylglycine-generating enzyme required for sulfatase activity/ribosomal protein L40E
MCFCGKCGFDLRTAARTAPQVAVCGACNARMPVNARFCGVCGADLYSTQTPAPVAPPEPGRPVTQDAARPTEKQLPEPVEPSPRTTSTAKPATAGPAPAGESPQLPPSPPPAIAPEAKLPPELEAAGGNDAMPKPVGSQPTAKTDAAAKGHGATSDDGAAEAGDATPQYIPSASANPVRAGLVRSQGPEAALKSPEASIRPMVFVPAGWFAMGSPRDEGRPDERPRRQVQLSAYYIDRCAVSNVEYERFDPGHRRLRPEVADGDFDPVVFVSFQDCLNYCRWRAEQEHAPPNTYLLPTEAQWERAARAGHDWVYPWGDEPDPQRCNTLEAERGRTVPVDEGTPNDFGLYHLGGNVREWCLDYYTEDYYAAAGSNTRDPGGPRPVKLLNMMVVRGAGFQDSLRESGRCAARSCSHPNSSADDIGFRCVRIAR